jgi:hypothetical protein
MPFDMVEDEVSLTSRRRLSRASECRNLLQDSASWKDGVVTCHHGESFIWIQTPLLKGKDLSQCATSDH